MVIDPIRGSIWKSNVNTFLGILFLSSVALLAGIIIIRAAWGINPIENAFAAAVAQETQLPQ